MNSSQKKTIQDILSDHNIELPGSDMTKTTLFMIFPLILMLLITNNPIFDCELTDLEIYKSLSFLLLIISLGTAMLSFIAVDTVQKRYLKDLSRFFSLFIGKILINFSVLLFFLVVCSWVILLGGIISSPFATILSISPVLLTIQFIQDHKIDFDNIYKMINKDKNISLRSKNTTKKVVLLSSFIPIFVVCLTLIIGQYCISNYNLHEYLLNNKFCEILKSDWYTKVYFFTYYFSVFIAAFGVLPKNITRSITNKLF